MRTTIKIRLLHWVAINAPRLTTAQFNKMYLSISREQHNRALRHGVKHSFR